MKGLVGNLILRPTKYGTILLVGYFLGGGCDRDMREERCRSEEKWEKERGRKIGRYEYNSRVDYRDINWRQEKMRGVGG